MNRLRFFFVAPLLALSLTVAACDNPDRLTEDELEEREDRDDDD